MTGYGPGGPDHFSVQPVTGQTVNFSELSYCQVRSRVNGSDGELWAKMSTSFFLIRHSSPAHPLLMNFTVLSYLQPFTVVYYRYIME
jgi:hypothetical protein